MLVFFWIFCPSRTFTCWGYVQFFDICSVYLYPSINITRIKKNKVTIENLSLIECFGKEYCNDLPPELQIELSSDQVWVLRTEAILSTREDI